MSKTIGFSLLLITMTFLAKAQRPIGYNFSVGDAFIMTTTIKKEKYQQLGSNTLTTKQTNTNTTQLEVVAVDGDVYRLKVTSIRRTVASDSPMGVAELDSDLEGEQNAALKVMTGKPYMLEMKNTGEVLRITGVAEISSEMQKELSKDTIKSFADRMLVQQALAEYKSDLLKSSIESQLFIYANSNDPEWVIKRGAIVNDKTTELDATFKWHDDKTILASAIIDVDIKDKFQEEGRDYTSQDVLTGEEHMTIDVDSKTGIPTKFQSIQVVDGVFKISEAEYPISFILEKTTTIVKK